MDVLLSAAGPSLGEEPINVAGIYATCQINCAEANVISVEHESLTTENRSPTETALASEATDADNGANGSGEDCTDIENGACSAHENTAQAGCTLVQNGSPLCQEEMGATSCTTSESNAQSLSISHESSDNYHAKERLADCMNSDTGVTQVDEPAPNLNLRFFRRAGRAASTNSILGNDEQSTGRPMRNSMSMLEGATFSSAGRNSALINSLSASALTCSINSQDGPTPHRRRLSYASIRHRRSSFDTLVQDENNMLINATLVEDDVIAVAQPINFCHKNGKAIAFALFIVLALLGTLMALTVEGKVSWVKTAEPTSAPSGAPSMAPSSDPRLTLEIVQERGSLRCGLYRFQVEGTFRYQLCQAIAAVVLNNPNGLATVEVTTNTSFVMLNTRAVDVLGGGETYTIAREVNEITTGSPFTFSTPFYYDGMVFAGNKTYINCAEDQKRYHECSGLSICVITSGTDYEYVEEHFSTGFFVTTADLEESLDLYSNGTCNVVATSRLDLLNYKYSHGELLPKSFVVGERTFSNDPLAFVTRPEDTEWSNIINWVVQALFYGERQGITKNSALCHRNARSLAGNRSTLNFLNAVYCVGNYAEIYKSSQLAEYERMTINEINNGTGLLYVIPYGNLLNVNKKLFHDQSNTFSAIQKRGSFKCGLLIQDGYSPNDIYASKRLFGMGVSYCKTLAASMLQGNFIDVNLTKFYSADESLIALNNEKVDVLMGVPANMDRNFDGWGGDGVTFSTPYYYGNETAKSDISFYPVMTRQDDVIFSSFVNCIVLSTIYALYEGIDNNSSTDMPLIHIFGNEMLWSLRDAISAMGNYDEIYFSNFEGEEDRSRADLNTGSQPQLLDMPGLVYM